MANFHLLLFLVLLSPLHCTSLLEWLSFSTSRTNDGSSPSPPEVTMNNANAKFSIESFSDPKGKKLLEEVTMKQLTLNSCWQEAYRNLFASCSEIIANEEKHSRLAWQLSNCFIRDSGRSSIPSCGAKSPMKECRKKLNDFEHEIYLQFFIQTNSICHQLQADAFKRDTERLVNDLKISAEAAEEKLESIEGKSEQLLHGSNQIHDSLTSLDFLTQQVADTSRNAEVQIHDVLKQSQFIFDQTKGISASQSELQEGQIEMKEKLESSMTLLQKSYESLGDGLENLGKEALEIENEINKVGDLMSSKMENLQSTADDIGRVAGVSLDKQKQLLNGQTKALDELEFLTKFQSEALEESRVILQNLAEFGHKQQGELLQRQEQIQQAHDLLFQNSQSILEAQEKFEAKQANIFAALDKLFALHNAILLESRFIKSFFFYSSVIFLLYMLTSTKQTFAVRARLYLGLCITFIVELAIVRFGEFDSHQQTWITSKVFLMRSSFLLVAALQILHSMFTFRDYEVLNHKMLQNLMEKISIMEQNTGKNLLSSSTDSDLNQYSWIDAELQEEVNKYDDPDYVLPEEIAENSICTSLSARKYDLRPRCRRQ